MTLDFTITCYYCSDNCKLTSLAKPTLTANFKSHFQQKHPNITTEKIENNIKQHLRQPKLRLQFSVRCPESECNKEMHGYNVTRLRKNLFQHVLESEKHKNKRKSYSKKLLETHVDQHCRKEFLPNPNFK